MTTIGIDNGSTGSIGILTPEGALFELTPTKPCLHYGKAGRISRRLDRPALRNLLAPHVGPRTRVFMERPFTGRFINAVLPAHRLFEATMCALEDLGLGFDVVDSKHWQHAMLGKIKGSAELKLASRLRGEQLYPHLATQCVAHGDADGLLIAHAYHHHLARA